MKNFATRLLAIVIVLSVLLMPASALAAERNSGVLTVGNFEMRVDDQTISLPLYLQLAGGADMEAARGFGTAKLLSGEETALHALAAVENGEIKAYLAGMEYGLTIPVEQVVSLIHSTLQAAEISVEDLMSEAAVSSSMSPELQAAAERFTAAMAAMMTAPAIEAEPDLGLVIEEGTEAEAVDIFDVTVQAVPTTVTMPEVTMTDLIDAMSAASPVHKEYWDAYFNLFDVLIAEAGVEDEINFRELMSMISMGFEGTAHTAEEGFIANMTINMTVTEGEESESISMPFILMSLTDENGVYSAGVVNMEVDGEVMQLTVYVDDYSEEGSDYTNFELTVSVGDVDSETVDTGIVLTLYTAGNETDGTAYGIDLIAEEYGNAMNMGGYYFALPAELSETEDSYSGYLYGYVADGTTEAEFYLDTNLTLSAMPEGELLTLANSINPLEADEAALEKLGNDAMTALMQGMMVLAKDPTIGAMMGIQ